MKFFKFTLMVLISLSLNGCAGALINTVGTLLISPHVQSEETKERIKRERVPNLRAEYEKQYEIQHKMYIEQEKLVNK